MKEKIMIKFLKSLFGFGSSTPVAPLANTAPYKVPEPAAMTVIPLVVENTPTPVAVVNAAEGSATQPVKAKAPAKPKAAAIKAPAKPKAAKPAATKAPTKAPAKPKAPATKKPKISIAK